MRSSFFLYIVAHAVLAGIATDPVLAQPEAARLGDKIVLDRPLASWERIHGVPGYVVRTQISNPGSSGFRLYFDQIRAGDVPFELRLIGSAGIVDRISGADFTAEDFFASSLYTAGELTLELRAPHEPTDLDFRLLDLQFEVPGGQPFAFVGAVDWENTVDLAPSDNRRALGRAVAKIIFRDEAGYDRACTGFLISPDRMLTNHHCLATQPRCSSATAIFGYLTLADPGENVRCREVLAVDADRDMAVVQLDRPAGDKWGVLPLAAVGPSAMQPLYVLQHPGGGPQKISVSGCTSSRIKLTGPYAGETFSHLCDTQGGSSGSPVLDAQTHQVVGLHYCCFPLWPDRENRAIPIDRVREKLPEQ